VDDSSDSNPYQAPSGDAATVVDARSDADALFSVPARSGKRTFQVNAFEDRILIREDNGKVAVVFRHDPMFAKLVENARAFVVKTPAGKWILVFEPTDFQTLKDWIGPPTITDLREALGGKSWWQLPVAALFLIPGPQQIFNAALAMLLLAHWVGTRFRPHRCFFLVQGLCFLLLFCRNAHETYQLWQAGESPSVFTIGFGIAFMFLTWGNLRNFGRYRRLAPSYTAVSPEDADSHAADHQPPTNW